MCTIAPDAEAPELTYRKLAFNVSALFATVPDVVRESNAKRWLHHLLDAADHVDWSENQA